MLLDQYWQPLFPGPGNLQDPVIHLSIGEGVVSFFSKELEKMPRTQQVSFTYTGSHTYVIWGRPPVTILTRPGGGNVTAQSGGKDTQCP